MKVAIVSTWDTLCGIAIFTRHIVISLPKEIEVKVFSEMDLNNVPNLSTPKDIPFLKCWSRLDRELNKLEEAILEYGPDLVHLIQTGAFFGYDNRLKLLFKNLKKKGIKNVLHLQTELPHNILYFASLEVDAYIANYFPEEEWVLVQLGLPKGKVHYIPFGILDPYPIGKKEARELMNIPSNAKMLLVTGFVREATGVKDIIKGILSLASKYPETLLVFAGYIHPDEVHPYRWINEGKELAKQLKIEKNVMFTEKFHSEKELGILGSATDVYIHYRKNYPWHFGSGTSFRSFAAGKPLIAFDCPVIDNIPQGMIRVLGTQELSNALMSIFENKELYDRLVKESIELREERSWKKMAKEYIKIWKELK